MSNIKVCDYIENEGEGQVAFKDYVEIHYGEGDEWLAISREEAEELKDKLTHYLRLTTSKESYDWYAEEQKRG